MLDKSKLSIYLDELDDDPLKACEIAKSLGISSICLRRIWATNIGKASDNACKQILNTLHKYNLSVLAICTDDGRVPANALKYDATTNRSLVVASYFRAKLFRCFAGLKVGIDSTTQINQWIEAIGNECTKSAIISILEIDPNSYVFEPADIAALLTKHKQWQLLYDPALLIAQRNQNPLIRYWYLLRNKVAAIDLHDFKFGSGFVPIGSGNCLFGDTIRDCIINNYQGWFIVEPGTTRRLGVTTSKYNITQEIINIYMQMVAKGNNDIANQTGLKSDKKR